MNDKRWTDGDRARALTIYSALVRRYGFDRVVRHMERGRLVQAVHGRVDLLGRCEEARHA